MTGKHNELPCPTCDAVRPHKMISETVAICDYCGGKTQVPSSLDIPDDAPVPDWFKDQVLGGELWPDAEWDLLFKRLYDRGIRRNPTEN